MKYASTFLGLALAGLAGACTVTTGGGFDEDDDLMFGDKPSWDTDDTDTTGDTDETGDAGATSDDATSSDETTDTTDTSSDETDTQTSEPPDGGVDTTDDTPSEPDAGGGGMMMCALEMASTDCDACLVYSCIEQVEACCDSSCAGEWLSIKQCMGEEPDPLMTREEQLDECLLDAAADGDEMSLSSTLFALTSCIEAPFEGDGEADPFDRQPGDGTCTYACYGTYTIND